MENEPGYQTPNTKKGKLKEKPMGLELCNEEGVNTATSSKEKPCAGVMEEQNEEN